MARQGRIFTITALSDPAIKAFIRDHVKDDVAALALKTMPDESWPRALVLDQIKTRQKAQKKLPGWAANEDIIFPASDVVEQCSSEATAYYKASLIEGVNSFADLTAGGGVDTAAFAARFRQGFAIEADQDTAATLRHNLHALGLDHVEVITARAEEALASLPSMDFIYLDPQRRDGSGKRGQYKLADLSPNILSLLPDLLGKAGTLMLKASPMLDIDEGMRSLGSVRAVHVVEWRGECRELLFLLGKNAPEPTHVPITATSIDETGTPLHTHCFTRQDELETYASQAMPERYLYEPGPAFMKAGGYNVLAARYKVKKLHPHTHLYTSEEPVADFPGRIFEIAGLFPVDRKISQKELPGGKANLAVRNFPATPEELKKRLKIRDGGDIYLFACTLADNSHVIVKTQKFRA